MLSIQPRRNADALKRYFVEDFALDGGTADSIAWQAARSAAGLSPTWEGRAAQNLQLPPLVTQAAFTTLCDNKHPLTLEQLTPRMRADRIAAYEFNFSVPKGVSLVCILAGDDRIIHAARTSAMATMREVERHMRVRVRQGGACEDRLTQNLAYALFAHRLARPENGVADPQVHLHAVAMNVSRDHHEREWKAGKFFDIKKNSVYFETIFHRAMQRELRLLGYEIETRGKSWDVASLPKNLTRKFSSRTKEIDRAIERDGVTNPKVAATYGARTRQAKAESVRGQDLRDAWDRRLEPAEREWLRTAKPEARSQKSFDRDRDAELRLRLSDAFTEEETPQRRHGSRIDAEPDPPSGKAAGEAVEFEHPAANTTRLRPSTSLRAVVRYTAKRIFERVGVVLEMDLIRQVLDAAPSAGISVDEVRLEMQTLNVNRSIIANQTVLMDPAALDEEKRMVRTVIAGRGQFAPLLNKPLPPEKIPEALRDAYRIIAASSDLVTLVEGFPGQGVRDLLRLLSDGLPSGPVLDPWGFLSLSGDARARAITPALREGFVVLSPSAAGARDGLRESGNARAETVERFVSDASLRNQALRGVVLVDQAHLLTTTDANRLLAAVKEIRGRLVLASEESLQRPNGPGNVPRVLWEAASVKPAFVGVDAKSKSPVAEPIRLAARGEPVQAVEHLKKSGRVAEVLSDHVPNMVAAEYLRNAKGKSKPSQSLVITPTTADSERFTDSIRSAMKDRGVLGKGKQRDQLVSFGFSTAAKGRTDTYKAGMVIEFNERASRKLLGVQISRTYKPGDRWAVLKATAQGILIGRSGRTGILPLAHADKFGVYEKRSANLAPGDVIRFTQNAKARTRLETIANKTWGVFKVPRHAVETGRSYVFERYTRSGDMQVNGSLVVPKKWGHFVHDYARTSAQAEGVKRDHIIYAQTEKQTQSHGQRALLAAMTSAKKSFLLVTDSIENVMTRIAEDRRRLTPTEASLGIVPPRAGLDSTGPRMGKREDLGREAMFGRASRNRDRDNDLDRGS